MAGRALAGRARGVVAGRRAAATPGARRQSTAANGCSASQALERTRERHLVHEGGGIPASRHIDTQRGFVAIDFRGRSSHEVSELYQAFALLCARGKVSGALLEAGEEDLADAHYALRDTLVTVACIAGVPLRFRLALVARSGAIAAVYRRTQRELRALGCDARVFRMEERAGRWLKAALAAPGISAATAAAAPEPAGLRTAGG